jgi:hypothetical protein
VSAVPGASADNERVGIGAASGLEQRLFDGTDGHTNRKIGADRALEIGDASAGLLPCGRVEGAFEIQLAPQVRIAGLDGVKNGELAANFGGDVHGETEDSFGIGT